MKRIFKNLLAILALCFLSFTTVNASSSLPTRFSANAYSSTKYFVGQADLMLPLKSDSLHNFYIDPNLAYGSDSEGYTDLGIGYRWVKNGSAILGGYLFGGYSRIANNARLWVVNPGIEALGSRWDARLNGYLVMGDRNLTVANFVEFHQFTVHSGVFNQVAVTQHAGDGVDAKLGYQLFPKVPLKAYIGSYFFSPSTTNNVMGGAVGLEYWLDQNIKVFAGYTYDNVQRSVGALGLGVEFGGTHVHRSDPSVEERITDPVERYLAALGRGSPISSQTKTQVVGQEIPIEFRDNLVFFSQTGGPNNGGMGLTIRDCTFEDPCGPTDLTNLGTQTLSSLIPNTRMFFLGGTYSALDVPGGTNPVTIRTGQSIEPAPGTPPSNFAGGFILEGNNRLTDITLEPTASTAPGPGVQASADNNLITGTQIGNMTNPFATGLVLTGATHADLISSRIFAAINGVTAADSASLTTNASMINVNGGDSITGINSTSSGPINLTQGSSVNLTGGNNISGVNSSGGGDFVLSDASSINVTGANAAIGLSTQGAGTVTVSGASSITTNASGPGSIGYIDAGSGDVNFSEGSAINVNSSATASQGYIHSGSANVNFSGGSSINVNATGQDIAAGFNDASGASGDIIFDASSINVTGANNTVGLISEGTGNLNVVNNSTVNVTAGNSSYGLNIIGNRDLNYSDSSLTFTGGNNSFGLSSSGNGDINLNNSTFNLTGGTTFIGCNTQGTGSFMANGTTITVNAGSNSFVCQKGGTGPVNFISGDILTMNAPGQTGVGGIHILTSSTSPLIFDGSQINVMGGDNARGIFIQGPGNVTVSGGSEITVAGGNNVDGIYNTGSGVVTLPDTVFFMGALSPTPNVRAFVSATGQNTITATGNNRVYAFRDGGSGSDNLGNSLLSATSAQISSGFITVAGTSTVINMNGTEINVTGGAGATGDGSGTDFEGSGNVNLTDTTITVKAFDSFGMYDRGSNVTISGGQINSTGRTSDGVSFPGNGTVTIGNGTIINSTSTGGRFAVGISLHTTSAGTIIANNVTVNAVNSNGPTNAAYATANTVNTSGSTTVNGSTLTANGGSISKIRNIVGTGPITINTSVCTLNGMSVTC